MKRIAWAFKNLIGFVVTFFTVGANFIGPAIALLVFVFCGLVAGGSIEPPATYQIDWIIATLIIYAIFELASIRLLINQQVIIMKFDLGRRYAKEFETNEEDKSSNSGISGSGPKIGNEPGDLAI